MSNITPFSLEVRNQWSKFSEIRKKGADESSAVPLSSSTQVSLLSIQTSLDAPALVHYYQSLRNLGLNDLQVIHELIRLLVEGRFGRFSETELWRYGIDLILRIATRCQFSPSEFIFLTEIETPNGLPLVKFYSKYIAEVPRGIIPLIVVSIEV